MPSLPPLIDWADYDPTLFTGIKEEWLDDALPKGGYLTRGYVERAVNLTDAPAVFHLAAWLPVFASLVPEDLNALRGGKPSYAHIWTLISGPPHDSRKTWAIGFATDILRAIDPGRLKEGDLGSDSSFMEFVCDRPRHLICQPEFSHFLAASAHQTYKAAIKTTMMSAWDGSVMSYAIKARGKKPTVDRGANPRMSVLGGVAPHSLIQYTGTEDWVSGFISRFMMFYAARERSVNIDSVNERPFAPDAPFTRAVMAAKQALSQMKPCAGLEDDAIAHFAAWAQGLTKLKAREEAKAVISRIEAQTFKVALLYALDRMTGEETCPEGWRVNLHEVQAATRVGDFAVMSTIHLAKDVAATREERLLNAILRLVPEGMENAVTYAYILKETNILHDVAQKYLITLKERGEVTGTSDTLGQQIYWRPYHIAPAPLDLPGNVADFATERAKRQQLLEPQPTPAPLNILDMIPAGDPKGDYYDPGEE